MHPLYRDTLYELQIPLDVYTAYLEKWGWLNAADTTTSSKTADAADRTVVAAVHNSNDSLSGTELMALDFNGYEAVILEIALLLYPAANCACKACTQERQDVSTSLKPVVK
jgi:hypothetical protein